MNRRFVAFVVFALLAAIGITVGVTIGTSPVAVVEWVQATGPLGVVLFGGLVFVTAAFMVPASFAEMSSGFLWGPLWGFLWVYLATWLSSLGCLALGRTVLREWVEVRLTRHPRFAALDRAIGEGGWALVMWLRLSPLSPFHVVTYALAATRVRFRDFAIGTALGSALPVFLYVYVGSTVTTVVELMDRPEDTWLYWLGLAVTVVVTIPITRYATRAVRAALDAA